MADQNDYYAILQVGRNAKPEDIERAYKRLSGTYGPQKSRKRRPGQRHATISAAYEVLRDPRRRRQYDVQMATGLTTAGRSLLGKILADRLMVLCGGIITISVLIVLGVVLLRVFGGGANAQKIAALTSPTAPAVVSGTPTPVDQTPGTTPPASPPSVTGDAITTADGLQYIIVRQGTGDAVTAGQDVTVNYSGWIQDSGKLFDSSFNPGRTPLEFALGYGKVIKGWDEGLPGMKIGELRRLIIPPQLASNAIQKGLYPADATLIYDVEVLSAVTPVTFTPTPAP